MSRQTGLVRYKGTLKNVRHFTIKGQPGDYAGIKGGPDASQVMNDPSFIRTRENMSEFGGCAHAGKAIRVGLKTQIKTMGDHYLSARFTAVMKKIQLKDTVSPRGQRNIVISGNRIFLINFNLNRNINLSSIFDAPYSLTNNVARNSATLNVPSFDPANNVSAPSGATHFKIINAITSVSDYAYDTNTNTYLPTDSTLNSLSDVQDSGFQSLTGGPVVINITTNLPGAPVMTGTVSVLNCIGIEFYQQIGVDFYLFAQDNAMLVGDVF